MPGVFTMVAGSHCQIYWLSIQYQFDGTGMPIDMSRDHLTMCMRDGQVWVYRIDCGERIIHSTPWKILNLHDPDLLEEIERMIKSL